MNALTVSTTAEIGSMTDVAPLATVGADIDFRALIASLSQIELSDAGATNASFMPLPTVELVKPEDLESDAGSETQPATDLQVAIAAMDTLPWPVSTAPPAPVSHATDQADMGTELVRAATTKLLPNPGTADAKVATTLPQQPATDAVSESAALIIKTADTGILLDTKIALTEHKHEERLESRGNQVVTELRANFSTVMAEASSSTKIERTVSVPVHDARWPAAVANEVRWCAQAGVQSATLKLVPENLGPIELHVDMQDNKVNVSFSANQLDTRTALEQSIPRLRELLAGSGLTLGQANVQQETRRDSQFAAVTPRVVIDDNLDAEVRMARIAIGLVDEYA